MRRWKRGIKYLEETGKREKTEKMEKTNGKRRRGRKQRKWKYGEDSEGDCNDDDGVGV